MRTIITCMMLLLITGINYSANAQTYRDRHGSRTSTVTTHTVVRTAPRYHSYRHYRSRRHPVVVRSYTHTLPPSRNGYYEHRSRHGNRVTYVPVGRRY